jgi:hypothetical protein
VKKIGWVLTLVFLRGCAGIEGWADTDAVTPTPTVHRHHHKKAIQVSSATSASGMAVNPAGTPTALGTVNNPPAYPMIGFTPTIGATASEESPSGPPKQ